MKEKRTKLPAGSAGDYERTAVRVSNVGIVGNAVLTAFKLLAGIFAGSGAMVSDAIHSGSDVFSSIIIIIGVKLSGKASDETHPYGHEKFESVAAIVLAIILCFTGLFIGHTAIEKLTAAESGAELTAPGLLALIAAVVSIVVKEAMYWYTRYFAKRIGSSGLMAEAQHHRSDALSSVGSLVGIYGARLGFPKADPIASLVICGFIVKASYNIFSDAIEKMVDHSTGRELNGAICACAERQDGVLGVRSIRGREFGSKAYIDLEIYADGGITLTESSRIADGVHSAIETEFSSVKHISVRAIPAPERTE